MIFSEKPNGKPAFLDFDPDFFFFFGTFSRPPTSKTQVSLLFDPVGGLEGKILKENSLLEPTKGNP